MTRAGWLFFIVALLAACVGCGRAGGGEEIPLAAWTLVLPDGSRTPITAPAHLDDRLPAQPITYALRTRVKVPPSLRDRDLEVGFPGLHALATARAGDVELARLDESPFDGYRPVYTLRYRIPESAVAPDGTLDLELRVAHRWANSAWIDGTPVLAGSLTRLVATETANRTVAITAFATTLFVALLYGYLAFALHDRQRRAFTLFAATAVANTFYPAVLLGITQPLFGIYDVAFTCEALIFGAASAIAFSKAYFGLERESRLWWVWVALCGIVAVVVRDPFRCVAVMGPLVVASTMANVIVQALLVLALRRMDPRPKNLYLIALAWPATSALGAPDYFVLTGSGDWFGGIRTANIGITVIALLQAAALLRDHLRSLKRADKLNAELASRVALLENKQREVELLNDELRRQIAARSRQLVSTLAHTDSPSEGPRLPLEGEIVEGRYRVVRLIGQGGMGAVFEVERLVDHARLAMKVLSTLTDAVSRARFAREAQIAANVKHPNVVSIVDFDVTADGALFLVMELVSPDTLRTVRKRDVDIPWTMFVLAQVADGLDAIHAQGIVHRDLKPANVLLQRGADGRRPLAKITDFGVSSLLTDDIRSVPKMEVAEDLLPPAVEGEETRQERVRPIPEPGTFDKPSLPGEPTVEAPVRVRSAPPPAPTPTTSPAPVDDRDRALTRPGIVFGTPNYMAAELLGGKATRAADIFSLGVIAFELLAHARPFEECPLRAKMKGRELVDAPPIAAHVAGLPEEVAALIDRCLSHDPARRPTARELAEAFRKNAQATVRPEPAASLPTRP